MRAEFCACAVERSGGTGPAQLAQNPLHGLFGSFGAFGREAHADLFRDLGLAMKAAFRLALQSL